jgi:invasion protein IalB
MLSRFSLAVSTAMIATGFAALAAAAQTAAPATAAPPAAAAAPPAAPGTAPGNTAAQDAANQFSVNQTVGDWVVRCIQNGLKSPAPCEMLQVTVNNNKQRVSSISIAYVPSRDSYALQLVVPIGVSLAKGVSLAAGDHSLNGMHFTRCERDGCYAEFISDQATINALQAVGKRTNVTVVGYGTDKTVPLPVSLNGFPEAIDRMKTYAKDKAVALPPPPNGAAAAPAPAAKPAAKGR